jgi:serine/threonine protein phosphatase PrpC
MNDHKLIVQAGFSSLQGRRSDNQDFGGYTYPGGKDLALRGLIAVVADGMGGMKGGRVAAETSVRMFLDGFYNLPATIGGEKLAARALSAVNRWVHAVGRRDPDLAGMATTFTALILRNRQAYLIHVGDTRIYRLRGDSLEKLTEDHTFKNPDMDHILYRAVGIDRTICADCTTHPLEAHDRFLLCSDGMYASLRESDIRSVLLERASPQSCAEALARLAFERGSQDNITALVVDVLNLPAPNRSVLEACIGTLPVLELPKIGQMVDNFQLEKIVSNGRYSCLFQAQDRQNLTQVILKFPHPRVAGDQEYYNAFLREAWVGARVRSPWVAEVIELQSERRTRLYSVLPYYEGKTLEHLIERSGPVSLDGGIEIALRLCKGIHALHRRQIIHRDIKPDNILLLDDGGFKLLDLGAARLPAWDDVAGEPQPGTASYLAPEQFTGAPGSESTDIFATGVTLYRMFARGAYPYGEIEPFSTPRYQGRPKSLAVFRPDLPVWLDVVLARALAIDSAERYADIMELAYDLESGLAKGGQLRHRKLSLYQRDPLLFWKSVSVMLLLAWISTLIFTHL